MSEQAKARSYRDLLVWQKGIILAKATYELTSQFPSEEKFALISQMRRAAVSVPSNLAEGQARRTTGDFIRFISNAEGSIAELDTQLVIAEQLRYCTPTDVNLLSEKILELRKMLNSLRRRLSPRG